MSTSRPSLAEVRAVAQAGVVERRSAEHWAGRLYMRNLSGRVTRVFVSTPALDRVTPDALTLAMIGVGLVAAGAVASSDGLWGPVVAVVLVQVYLLLDCVDGEVARWRRVTSARGVYLDRLGHHVVEAALVVALGMRAAGGLRSGELASGPSWWLVLGFGAALLVVLGKLESDLVVVARAGAGLSATLEQDPTSSVGPVRRLRRLVAAVPVHRLIGAVEVSLALMVVAVVDHLRGDLLATQLLLAVLAVVALVVAVGHPVTILTSKRLR
jgi:phosphatidylglycerophosphate synthase